MRKVWFSYNKSIDIKVAKLQNLVDTKILQNKYS